MRLVVDYYERGYRVKKSAEQAQFWRNRIAQAELAALRNKGTAGDIAAIEQLNAYYEGRSTAPESAQEAASWRERLEFEKQQRALAAKNAEKERRIAELQNRTPLLKQHYNMFFRGMEPDSLIITNYASFVILSLPTVVGSAITDGVVMTRNNREIERIRNEASVHPSRWAKPESMIAKAESSLPVE